MSEEQHNDGASPLAGVWDRFMTPGVKIQYIPKENPETGEIEEVPKEYDFSEANLKQCVQNFSRTFSERRLVLDDGNHRAGDPLHVRPQELARYSGEAVIWGGQVVAFWDQHPDLAPPEPAQLLAALQQRFPRATSADGLWGYRREVTELGERLLPNMHQISPQFSSQDRDEAGNEIGYNIDALSPVYVAHQNGTVLMSKKPARSAMGQPSSAVHAPRPLNQEEAKMADEKPDEKKEEGGDFAAKLRKAVCAKYGIPEGAPDDAIMTAVMAAGGGGEQPLVVDKDKDGMGKAAMSDLPKEEIPGNEQAKPNDQTSFAKVQPILSQLSKRVETAERDAAEAKAQLAARTAKEREQARAAFSKRFREEEGRWAEDDEAGLLKFLDDMGGDIDKASAHIERHLPPRAAFARHTRGGHPVDTTVLKKSVTDKAAAFSKRQGEIFAELKKTNQNHNAAFAAAQQRAKAEDPEGYAAYSGGR